MTDLSLSRPRLSEHRTHNAFRSLQLEDPFWGGFAYQSRDENKSPAFPERSNISGPQHSQRHDLQGLKDEILKKRLGLRELRTDLGRQRAKVREMQIKFWEELQNHRNNSSALNLTVLDELHEDITQALDVLGPEEEDYNEKEDDLNVLEYRLESLEADNNTATGSSDYLARPQSFTTISSRRNSIVTMHSQRYQPDNDVNSPMYRYLSRLGDARIIRERLYELRSEKAQYLDIQRDREALGHPQYQPNIDFLADYEKMFNEEFSQLQIVEMDVAKLAREAGLEPPNPSGELINDARDSNSSHIATPNSPTQTIAATPASPRATLTPTNFSTLPATFAARQPINDWILSILKLSPLERARHKAILEEPNLDDVEWASLVGKYWQPNQAGFDEEAWRGSISPEIERRQISPHNQSRRGSPAIVKPVSDSGKVDTNEHRLERSSYDTDSLIAGATGPNSSPFLRSSFSSISQSGFGFEDITGSGNGFRPLMIASKLSQVSRTSVGEKPGLGMEDELRKGLIEVKVRKSSILIVRLDVWISEEYHTTLGSDNESLAEEVIDCFIGDREGDFENIKPSRLYPKLSGVYIKVVKGFQRNHDPAKFFVVGKVFMLARWEAKEAIQASARGRDHHDAHGNEASPKVYRFVVVKANPNQDLSRQNVSTGYSMCLRISSRKRTSGQAELAVIYTGRKAPKRQPDEKGIRKDPLKVQAANKTSEAPPLPRSSRVNFARTYLVEHNVKVLDIGRITKRDTRKLVMYWRSERSSEFPKSDS